jgi:uncharacterized protein
MDIVQEIKNFVETECKKPTSKYGYWPFPDHFIPMVNCANQLAEKMNKDKEIIALAAWLHDIGSIVHGRENHHITGAEIAQQKLEALNYPKEKIKLIKRCILNHRGSMENNRTSVEEQIIAEADAISNFDNITGVFAAAFLYENKNHNETKKSVRTKLQNKWDQLQSESSRKLVRARYEAAMLLLS